MIMPENLFHDLPSSVSQELTDVLASNHSVRVQRIVSTGHCSPAGFWYDQDEHEWVVVLTGEARLSFEDTETIHLKPGDHVTIQAHRKHRVQWTKPGEPTIWLAVFYKD